MIYYFGLLGVFTATKTNHKETLAKRSNTRRLTIFYLFRDKGSILF